MRRYLHSSRKGALHYESTNVDRIRFLIDSFRNAAFCHQQYVASNLSPTPTGAPAKRLGELALITQLRALFFCGAIRHSAVFRQMQCFERTEYKCDPAVAQTAPWYTPADYR